jgi:membrane-bound serine protease (ClpP class)
VVVHPRTVLGGSGAYQPNDKEIEDVHRWIKNELSKRKGRPWSLMAAMIDPHLTVYSATKLGDTEYFCDDELAEQLQPDKWVKGQAVTTPGLPLKLSGAKAEEYHLANYVVKDFAQFKQCYGLEKDLALIEPGWADFLIKVLATPGVSALLLLIGLASLYIELHVPGIGIGGFVATVCFLLFFWSRYLGGTAGALEISLFIAGITCLLLEVFVIPGFGIFGLGGGALVLASLILASQTFIFPQNDYQVAQLQNSLLMVAGACIGLFVVAMLLRHRLPRSRIFGNMMLAPPEGAEAETIRRRESLGDYHDLLGQRGTTTTQLTPCGKARFGDQLVDVMADGEVIDRGAIIEVVEVRGTRVMVQEIGRE